MTTVAIFGGGIGGLSAAHELAERGFEVHVYERNKICGGKARSLEKDQTGTGGRPNLPGEHGFRFFPGFYQHLDDTMRRIPLGSLNAIAAGPTGPSTAPIGGPTVYDNLVDAGMFAILQNGQPPYQMTPDFPTTVEEWVEALDAFFSNSSLGLANGEKTILLKRLLFLFAMCPERREAEYECVTWWDYHNVPTEPPLSGQYNKMFVTGFSRAFVAMDAEKASTMTGANTLSQFFRVFFGKGTMDRVLNAPTNDAWINPWVAYLKHIGVTFHQNETLTALNVSTGPGPKKITSATLYKNTTDITTQVTADYYIAAVPVEVMTELTQANAALTQQSAAPELGDIHHIEVSWMTGIMFYLNQDVPIVNGHVNFADSKWALTGISQPQFWPNTQLTNYGNGAFQGLLSIVISDWTEPGDQLVLKRADACIDEQEVAKETWAQILPHLSHFTPPLPPLPTATPEFFLDPAIKFPVGGGPPVNEERFLTNMACTLQYRPEAATSIGNLMLASDYVKTHVDIATMEGANEAGRRAANAVIAAANAVLAATGSGDPPDPPCGVWKYAEPAVFDLPHEIDKTLLDAGLPSIPWGGLPFP